MSRVAGRLPLRHEPMVAGRALHAATTCNMPGPTADDAARKALERGSYTAPELGALRVSFLRAGALGGKRVMFVHGTPGAADGWADFLLNVPAGFEYIAVDRPGFGDTFPNRAEPSLARQAAALAPLLNASSPPILVGHSYGGPDIVQLAIEHPQGVAGVVIAAGALDPAQEKVHRLQPVGEWWAVRNMLPTSLRNANRELLALKGELTRLSRRLGHVEVPLTIIHGTADTLVPYANVRYVQRHFTGSRQVRTITLPQQSHFLPWEHRPVIEGAIRELVEQ